ncbi:hypothetical protein [Halorubellus sp. PRR65]|uniref:hypothetical protein n=1 Tax=Halorubellus sp. PRR65 TaxID=3098148 RepID=UPI002B261446|nr:hypothetical protein [Halorubellus sp. PRR65]
MTREYTFEETTVDDIDYVIANPTGNGEIVRMDAEWFECEGVEGKWEDAARAVLDAALFGSGTVEDGVVRVARSTAVDALAETLDGVRGEPQADALVAYLASVDVWNLDRDDVVVLRDSREGSLSGREVLTWAAAVDVCIERIDAVREALEQSDVDSLERSNADAMLESLRQFLDLIGKDLRVRALQRRDFPDDAVNMVESLGTLTSELADVGQVDATAEDTSVEELAQMVEDDIPELDVNADLEGHDEGGSRVD